jgi:hypothetical protein
MSIKDWTNNTDLNKREKQQASFHSLPVPERSNMSNQRRHWNDVNRRPLLSTCRDKGQSEKLDSKNNTPLLSFSLVKGKETSKRMDRESNGRKESGVLILFASAFSLWFSTYTQHLSEHFLSLSLLSLSIPSLFTSLKSYQGDRNVLCR